MKHTEYLKYEFSEDELKECARQLARESTALAETEAAKKAAVAQFAERVASAKSNIAKFSRYIGNGYDYRLIDCYVQMNIPSPGVKTIRRLDTDELVKTVAMTEKELQEEFKFDGTLK